MKGLLKFITCGSVDDGKSTLIGHILYDSKLLYADQEKALALDSKVGSRGGEIDYSLLLDGLMAEREQGITVNSIAAGDLMNPEIEKAVIHAILSLGSDEAPWTTGDCMDVNGGVFMQN